MGRMLCFQEKSPGQNRHKRLRQKMQSSHHYSPSLEVSRLYENQEPELDLYEGSVADQQGIIERNALHFQASHGRRYSGTSWASFFEQHEKRQPRK